MNCQLLKTTEFKITQQAVDESATNIIPAGEVVISTHVGLGKVCVLAQDTAINQDLKAVIPTADVSRSYLYHWFVSKATVLISNGTGATVKGVTVEFVKQLVIPLPPLPTQRAIAEELDRICELKRTAEKLVEKYRQLIKAKFSEMFGDPEVNAFGWSMKTFSNVCKVRQGLQIPIAQRLKFPEEDCYEYITIAYLHGSKEREYIKSPKPTVVCVKDDVLMTRTGNTGMVVTDVAGVFHNNFFLIDYDRSIIEKRFLVSYLRLPITQLEIRRRAGTSTVPDLNHSAFYTMSIFIPPLPLQREFAVFVEKVEKLEAAAKATVEKYDLLYRSKLQEYFG